MRIIGLVGGVASGKSLVARQLAERGAAVIDADRLGHEVLRWPEVIEAAQARWGAQVVGADGQLDRAAIAQIVFAPTPVGRRELEFLTSLTHPGIGRLAEQRLDELRKQGQSVAVLDAPVMLEAGWDRLCDEVWFVDAPQAVREQRALARGWSAEQFAAREAAQLPVAEKRQRADRVVDNSGSAEATAQQIERFWPEKPG